MNWEVGGKVFEDIECVIHSVKSLLRGKEEHRKKQYQLWYFGHLRIKINLKKVAEEEDLLKFKILFLVLLNFSKDPPSLL